MVCHSVSVYQLYPSSHAFCFVLQFGFIIMCCSPLLYIIMSTSQEHEKAWERDYTTYTERFPESLGNKDIAYQILPSAYQILPSAYQILPSTYQILTTRNHNSVYFVRVSASVLHMVDCLFFTFKNSSTYARWIEVTVIGHSKCLMGGKLCHSYLLSFLLSFSGDFNHHFSNVVSCGQPVDKVCKHK